METTRAPGLLDEVRDFLQGLRGELPELFDVPRAERPDEAQALIEARVAYFAPLMGVRPNRVFVKDQRTRWGSCSAQGNLNFNWRLTLAPREVLDYVVVHELAHLVEMNHGKAFWRLVSRWCPDHKAQRRWLRRNAETLWQATRASSAARERPPL